MQREDGEQTRSFTYVEDTVEGTIRASFVDGAVGADVQHGSDREVSINQLARLIIQLSESRSEIVHVPAANIYGSGFEETRRRVPHVARAREVMGFEAQVGLDDGLRRTVDWFRSKGLTA